MDFIQGLVPSNPIDEEKQKRIQEIATEVVTSFGKNYLFATKVCSSHTIL